MDVSKGRELLRINTVTELKCRKFMSLIALNISFSVSSHLIIMILFCREQENSLGKFAAVT